MTEIRAGVVDVFVVDPLPGDLRVLLMRRAAGVRCTGAWEVVHGSIEPGERPEDAAEREVREETGFVPSRLYNVNCNPFYVHKLGVVQVAVVFAAVADSALPPTLSEEHDLAEWVPLEEAVERLAWPRSRATVRDIQALLKGGDAGVVEDVLRVR